MFKNITLNEMKKIVTGMLAFVLFSCGGSGYQPVEVDDNSNHKETDAPQSSSFKVKYKETQGGVKTVHVKLNDVASFDAIFDTGCSDVLISVQEAVSLIKAGTLTDGDARGTQYSSIASGEVVENMVFNVSEIALVDTEGNTHKVYNVPVSVAQNPGASILLGNAVIDKMASHSYTINLDEKVIEFE